MAPSIRKIRAVVYGRVSSDEQARKDFSIPKIQIPDCVNYIKEENWQFVNSYIDEGFDCNAFEKRAELQKMLKEDINKYDVVIVWSYDRLTGDDENTRGMIYHILDKNGKQMTSVKQKARIVNPDEYDPKSLNVAQGRQITDIGVSFDRKVRRERFMESRAKTVANGRHISEPPYGYKLIRKIHPEDEKRTIAYRVINEEESPILKRIFEERITGKSQRKIAFDLNENGIKTRKGRYWSNARIAQVLKNPYPAGYIVWNKTTQRKYGDESKRTTIPEEKWIYYPVNKQLEKHYKTIIKKELFDKVQEIRKRNGTTLKGRGSFSPNILSGLLKCPVCGRPMVECSGHHLKSGYLSYYICSSKHNDGVCKTSKRVRAPELKKAVVSEVVKYLRDPNELKEYQKQQREEEIETTEKELLSYGRKLETSQTRIRSLNIKYIDGKMKEDYYKELLIGLEDEEEKLKKIIYETKEKLKGFEKERDVVMRLKEMGKNFYKKFQAMDNLRKKQILQTLVREIKLNDNQVKIYFKV